MTWVDQARNLVVAPQLGAGTRNRTADLLITNQSLYRLSYSGIGWGGW